MNKTIEPNLKVIKDYLGLKGEMIFVIPEYQRAYSWNLEQCDKLWQDILSFSDGSKKDNYFFGTIIVNCQHEDDKLRIIDGQQRTVTFYLLLKALLLNINKCIKIMPQDNDAEQILNRIKARRKSIIEILYKADKDIITDNLNEEDKLISSSSPIMENYSINESDGYKNDFQKIISGLCFEEIEKNVKHIQNKRNDNKYTNFFRNFKYFYTECSSLSETQLNKISRNILEDCEVIEIKSWQIEQAIAMFNSLNSDGLPLYDSDIISAKLYSVAKVQNKEEEFSEAWKKLKDTLLRQDLRSITNIDGLLMQRMYYERAINKEIINNVGGVNVTTPGLRRYYNDLIDRKILNDPLKFSSDLINLAMMWCEVIKYPDVQVLFKLNENFKLFLASFLYRFNVQTLDKDSIHKIIECMLRIFALLELVDIGYSSKKFKTFLFAEEVKLANNNVNINEIMTDFDEHIKKNWDKETIRTCLMEYDGNALIYLNEYLYACEVNNSNFDISSRCDIEHIMPISGHNLDTIKKDANIYTENEFISVVNKLGNKILLEEKINRALGNDWFRTKISCNLNERKGYINSKYPIANALVHKYKTKNKPFWTKEDIEKATEKSCTRIIKFIFAE